MKYFFRYYVLIGIVSAVFFVMSAGSALAQATLFVSPATGAYKVGDLFSVLIVVNTGGTAINAGTGQLNFDNSRLEVQSIGYARSAFTLWTEEPTFSNPAGTIRFSGGTPNPGFNGPSGAIVRVTFKATATGQAPISFVTGSALANDGKGTNILDTFRGGLFSISPASPTVGETSRGVTSTVTPSKGGSEAGAAPIITGWPSQIEEGLILTVQGLGYPGGKTVVYFQKGEDGANQQDIFPGPDGHFSVTLPKAVTAGFYRVWAKNVSPDGTLGNSSEVVIVEVVKPLFFRIGSLAISYASIAATLLGLLVLIILLAGWGWLRLRRWHEEQGKEISEAEKAVHTGFDKLKEGLAAYVSYLTETKSPAESKRRETRTKQELKEELEDIEKKIEEEIEDVRPKRK